MAIHTLTEKAILAAIKSAKATGKASALNDGGGLLLDVRPTGAGWWRLRYWIATRENRMSLGTYPEVSLRDARQRCKEMRELIAAGIDPSPCADIRFAHVFGARKQIGWTSHRNFSHIGFNLEIAVGCGHMAL